MQKSRPQIQKDNLEAQLIKLRNQTASAVSGTRQAVELKKQRLAEVENLDQELAEKREKLSQLLDVIDTSLKKQTLIETAIEQSELKSSEKLDAAQKELDSIAVGIADKKAEIEGLTEEKSVLHEVVELTQSAFEKEKTNHSQILDSLGEEITSKKKELSNYESKISDAIVILDDITTQTVDFERELQERLTRIEKRESDLQQMADNLQERVRVQDQREADFKVIHRRLKRKYENEFPGRKLNI